MAASGAHMWSAIFAPIRTLWPGQLIVLVLIGLSISVAHAQDAKVDRPVAAITQPIRDPRQPEDPIAAKAFVALKRHCAGCHGDQPKPGAFAHILDMARLGRDSSLVIAGRPDASPLYQAMVTQQKPPHATLSGEADTRVLIREIRAVREWIDSVPPSSTPQTAPRRKKPAQDTPTCATAIAPDDANNVVGLQERWLLQIGAQAARDTRFLHLAGIAGSAGCGNDLPRGRPQLADVLSLLKDLATAHADQLAGSDVQVLAEGDRAMLALRLGGIGVTRSEWDAAAALSAQGTEASSVSTANDAAVERLVRLTGSPHPSASVAAMLNLLGARWKSVTNAPALPPWITAAISAQRPATDAPAYRGQRFDLDRAAVTLNITAADLKQRLLAVEQAKLVAPARHLAFGGVISPSAFGRVAKALDAARPVMMQDTTQALPDIYIWPDAKRIKKGAVVSLNIATTTPCYVTLVAIDGSGRATVLFPNDFDQDNVLRPGRRVAVPHPTAPFQLRKEQAGAETILAICMADTPTPPGITHRFDRQRFTLLGNWRRFIDMSLTAEREARRAKWRKEKRRQRKTSKAKAGEVTSTGNPTPAPERQWWSAITLVAE